MAVILSPSWKPTLVFCKNPFNCRLLIHLVAARSRLSSPPLYKGYQLQLIVFVIYLDAEVGSIELSFSSQLWSILMIFTIRVLGVVQCTFCLLPNYFVVHGSKSPKRGNFTLFKSYGTLTLSCQNNQEFDLLHRYALDCMLVSLSLWSSTLFSFNSEFSRVSDLLWVRGLRFSDETDYYWSEIFLCNIMHLPVCWFMCTFESMYISAGSNNTTWRKQKITQTSEMSKGDWILCSSCFYLHYFHVSDIEFSSLLQPGEKYDETSFSKTSAFIKENISILIPNPTIIPFSYTQKWPMSFHFLLCRVFWPLVPKWPTMKSKVCLPSSLVLISPPLLNVVGEYSLSFSRVLAVWMAAARTMTFQSSVQNRLSSRNWFDSAKPPEFIPVGKE